MLLKATQTTGLPGSCPPSPLRGQGRGGGDLAACRLSEVTPTSRWPKSIFVKYKNRASVVLPPQGGGGENRECESRLTVVSARRLLAVTAMTAGALLVPAQASAFCGFYVAKADAKLFNKASKVVVARKGEQTAITMASDYQGDPKEFALVVPVPSVIQKDQIKIADNATVDHLDAYSAPRLVEYFDPDPCAPQMLRRDMVMMNAAPAAANWAPAPKESAKALGVKVEAQYTVGEYDIAILSATQSDGLATYLNQEGYKVPAKAAPVLASYIKQDMKFFVAKVNLKEQAKAGAQYLRPIQVNVSTPKFMLPIRLGTVNADGPQDMIVLMLTEKGRVETTNYKTLKIPSNMDIPIYTKKDFGSFYRAMFAQQVKTDGGKAVYLEYAWNMGWCDPCAADPVPNDKLVAMGATWIDQPSQPPQPGQPAVMPMPRRGGGGSPVFITRLHVRYDAASFPEDLMFQETADRTNYQGRYVLRHPFPNKGGVASSCPQMDDYKRGLSLRFVQEAATLSHLTGWDLATIKKNMSVNGQKIE
jgi:hypothetical protein